MENNTKIKVLIVEDELYVAEYIKHKLHNLGYHTCGIAFDVLKAEELLIKEVPDIILLDIMLDGKEDGIALAKKIRNNYQVPIIFVTSYADKGMIEKLRQIKPDGYLVKPFDDKDLFTAIEISLFRNAGNDIRILNNEPAITNTVIKDSIFIRNDFSLIKIKFEELKWIKSEGNYLDIFCTRKKYLTRSTLKDFVDKLPQETFLQVHKSYAVNINFIEAIQFNQLVIDNEKIPIGRSFTSNIKKVLQIDI